ncbi:MAG: hypothetical protein CH6_1087 [Candidatus Kapaibacterium sp.]|nr:MAG: hypothetical protein CH6_1087 [Candidatus Kapabacteria bacterium]
MAGLEPTYKELKQILSGVNPPATMRLEPTYKELKQAKPKSLSQRHYLIRAYL